MRSAREKCIFLGYRMRSIEYLCTLEKGYKDGEDRLLELVDGGRHISIDQLTIRRVVI